MLAAFLIALGIAMAAYGARLAGSAGGFATDHSGQLPALEPVVQGSAADGCGWTLGVLLQTVGYIILLTGVMAAL